ncbi:MAG TPA: DUF932 domain-containing protein [Chthoniobacterales bacterium]
MSDDALRRVAPSVFAAQPMEGVSDRYSFLPTSSILKGMRGAGWLPVRAAEQPVRNAARQGFQKHCLRFARAEHLERGQLHQVRPELVLLNSHDRSSAYQLHCGLFRLVCLNGLVVADATFARIALKHAGFHPDAVTQASFALLEAVPGVMDKVKLFQDRVLTDAERRELAAAAVAFRWGSAAQAPVSPEKLLTPRRYGDGQKDLWTTFNCIQENAVRGGQRDPSRRRPNGQGMPRSRALTGIDEDLRLNKALWEMAETLRAQTP